MNLTRVCYSLAVNNDYFNLCGNIFHKTGYTNTRGN